MADDVRAAAERWLAVDPDPETRAELTDLLAGDPRALAERFAGHLRFGTAGLRAELGAGPLRMNRVVVRQAAAGLAAWLPAGSTVVIGHDARRNSDHFAADSAAVLASAGHRAVLLPGELPTPVLAFAVRALGAGAGVMVTASHNPPADNGYKVYLSDGAQLVPPLDEHIEAAIVAAGLPPAEIGPPAAGGRIDRVGDEIVERYLDAVVPAEPVAGLADLTVAYTPLHGVGGGTLARAFARLGIPVEIVAEQAGPDPDFPTVSFPNPEEPGAMDLLLALARGIDADVAMANDPDADRLAAAVPDGRGGWRVLSGNELGVLLGDYRIRTTSGANRLVVATVVSSSLLGKIAAAAGVRFAETLTGFKWVMRPAIEDPSARFVFGYEEALGYAVTDAVRDKDGISAAVALCSLVAEQRAQGRSVLDQLDDLERRHGVHVSAQRSLRRAGPHAPAALAAAMGRVRAEPPAELAGEAVTVIDFLPGGPLPSTDLLRFDLADGSRVLLRPSGTEPKLKIYVEVVGPPGAEPGEVRPSCAARAAALADAAEVLVGG